MPGDTGKVKVPGSIKVDDVADLCIKCCENNQFQRATVIVSTDSETGRGSWEDYLSDPKFQVSSSSASHNYSYNI